MSDAITYNQFFVTAADGLTLGPDRHPKWQRVEPGTVIPAGQPSRSERSDGYASEVPGSQSDWNIPPDGLAYFVDSSWKPPLVLPTEIGSVIEASVEDDEGKGFTAKFMRGLRGTRPWVDSDIGNWYGDDELSDVTVLFDAGAAR